MLHLKLKNMSDFDDLLALVGNESTVPIEETPPEVEETIEHSSEEPTMEVQPSVPEESPETTNLSDDDFSEILNDIGFVEEPEDEEDFDVVDLTADDEEEERDLDAEEDADWDAAIVNEAIAPAPIGRGILDQIEAANVAMEDAIRNMNASTGEIHISTDAVARDVDFEESLSQEPPPPPQEQLPLNSPTLLIDESTTRFSGAEWFNEIQKKRIIVAGIGGIGSWLAIQLARMTPAALYLYDDDNVESVNLAGQLYCKNDVGKAKVDAITDTLSAYTSMTNIFAIKEKFTTSTEAADIMMCGFDNMGARRGFYGAWLAHVATKPEEERKYCLYLDGRLSMDTLQVLCITGDDVYNQERYSNEFLFSDADAEETVCSMKQTTYLACMIGSVMVNLFTNWTANLLDPIIPYDLPFFTEYDAQNMIFKTEK